MEIWTLIRSTKKSDTPASKAVPLNDRHGRRLRRWRRAALIAA
ncbi:hypothetical protein [Luteithermobacter gelatinilyticus]|nr:hypothetical protein [Luteithermobacter gelatinilyticus]|tara:strand:+ start:350 stop:478 length:129 start_codon:yes stop_codon:yes gene_type:complete